MVDRLKMGALNYKQILVLLHFFMNLILSVNSLNEKQSQILSNLHQKLRKVEEHHPKFSDHSFKEVTQHDLPRHLDEDVDEFDNDSSETENTSLNDGWERKSKPLRNIFMGIYKNYKSTYLGNKTSLEYRKSMQDGWNSDLSGKSTKKNTKLFTPNPLGSDQTTVANLDDMESSNMQPTDDPAFEDKPEGSTKRLKLKRKKKKKKKNKGSVVKKDEPLLYSFDGEYRYNIGPGVNISLDMKQDVVSVNLDEDCLKEILLGRWVDGNEGRGKKYEMISKILPLFILPFLIQSAIIPFLVTKLKLLLIKSILVGKLAIFLLVISAIKNNQKVATYEPAPAYWASEPSRRSEIYNGYRVEGRPTTWVQ